MATILIFLPKNQLARFTAV